MGQSAGVDRASKPPSRRRCLLLALADVELRCCMQWLSLRDALHWARCNKRTRDVADDSQGWAGCTLQFDFSRPPPRSFEHDRLLRHVWTAVRWPATLAPLDEALFARLFSMLPQRIRELDLSRSYVSLHQWRQILGDPRSQHWTVLHWTVLHMGWRDDVHVDAEVLELVTKLPRLHTLSVASIEGASDCWRMLADAPALTSLSIQDVLNDSRLPYVAACTKLTSLHLRRPDLYGDNFLVFFSSPNIRRLRHLEIETFSFLRAAGQAAEQQMASVVLAFKGMESLESLKLCEVPLSEWIAPVLAQVKTLRRLVIQPAAESSRAERALDSLPSMLSLMHLLDQASQVTRVILRVPSIPPSYDAIATYKSYLDLHCRQAGHPKLHLLADGPFLVRPNLDSDRFWIEWIEFRFQPWTFEWGNDRELPRVVPLFH